MAVELKVPEVGESITEVQIGDWLKSEGDRVQKDETLVMIETDKVTVELPAPVSGVLSQIKVKKGEEASVGDVIGYVEEGAEAAEKKRDKDGKGEPQKKKGEEAATQVVAKSEASSAKATSDEQAEPAKLDVGGAKAEAEAEEEATPSRRRSLRESLPPQAFARVMPSARRIMKEKGLHAEQIKPTGPGGRVLKEDAERAAKAPERAPERPPTAPTPEPGGRQEEAVAMTPMRRRIAERLVESQHSAALLTTFNEIDMSAAMTMRKEYQPLFQEKYGIKLGFMSFFVKAAVEALKLVPQVNAEIRGEEIVYKNYYDIGVAVGGGRGLVVPIIRNAERSSFAELEQTIADFAKRAQGNKLKLEELQGGTFTISNGGIYGSLLSTPIINPPQSGILGMHAIQDRPVVRDGQIVVRAMMYVALTYDHRLVDGREAVTFLKRVKECVEQPSRILLEV
jgi:2-oxoglutarate dehydrogenase E2 component (dihydrolipoamide succinyltransferase)